MSTTHKLQYIVAQGCQTSIKKRPNHA